MDLEHADPSAGLRIDQLGDRELIDIFPRLKKYFVPAEEIITRAPATD